MDLAIAVSVAEQFVGMGAVHFAGHLGHSLQSVPKDRFLSLADGHTDDGAVRLRNLDENLSAVASSELDRHISASRQHSNDITLLIGSIEARSNLNSDPIRRPCVSLGPANT